MNGYELSRAFWNWSFDNPEKIKPNHSAIYFFAIEHCNRLGWKEKFGFPSQMVMEALGIKNWRTYSKALNDLVEFGFIDMLETSKNQYSSNIIAIVKNTKAPTKALDKALSKHLQKQGQSIVSIVKQLNKEQYNKEQLIMAKEEIDILLAQYENVLGKEEIFLGWWEMYNKKVGKELTRKKFLRLSDNNIQDILKATPFYVDSTKDVKYRKNPATWLNGKHWNDEIIKPKVLSGQFYKNSSGKTLIRV